MNALRYLADTLLTLLVLAFLLRLMLQIVRANFRDPFADAVVRVTNWLVLPLRRVLPPIGKVDTATLVAVLLAEAAHETAVFALSGIPAALPLLILRLSLVNLASMTIKIYLVAIFLYAIVSFISPGGYAPGIALVESLCGPPLRAVRRVVPPIGQIDFSPMWLAIALIALLILLGQA